MTLTDRQTRADTKKATGEPLPITTSTSTSVTATSTLSTAVASSQAITSTSPRGERLEYDEELVFGPNMSVIGPSYTPPRASTGLNGNVTYSHNQRRLADESVYFLKAEILNEVRQDTERVYATLDDNVTGRFKQLEGGIVAQVEVKLLENNATQTGFLEGQLGEMRQTVKGGNSTTPHRVKYTERC